MSSRLTIFKDYNAHLINHLFQYILILYLILLLLEQIFTGFVTQYLNLNYLLIVVIVVGIFDVFSEHPTNTHNNKKPTQFDYIFIFVLGILGFAIIKFKTLELGMLSWLISIIAGVLIILLSILILQEDDQEEGKNNETQ